MVHLVDRSEVQVSVSLELVMGLVHQVECRADMETVQVSLELVVVHLEECSEVPVSVSLE